MKYAIQSRKNGKFLSNIAAGSHDQMFQAEKPEVGKAYFYGLKRVADSIARKENAKTIKVK